MPTVNKLLIALCSAIIISGCATGDFHDSSLEGFVGPVELTAVPFYPQSRFQCGPAALASVLNYSGLDIDKEQLAGDIYIPGRKGSLQVEIIAAIRRYGRVPYIYEGNLQSILVQLQEKRPSLVLLNLGLKQFPVYHYAVVVGYQPESDEIILRSGTDARRLMGRKMFLSSWNRAGNWALVVLPAGVLPRGVNAESYLEAIIALEAGGQWQAVEMGYLAVLQQQPENLLARFGLANSLRMQGNLEAAVIEYEKLLNLDGDYKPGLNNLADTLLQLGRCQEAAALLQQQTIAENPQHAVDQALLETLIEIELTCSTAR